MSKICDGGPAFPLENPRHLENGDLFKQFPGMSLRDWFAGQALALLAPLVTDRSDEKIIARQAAVIADALLAELKGGEG